MRSFDPPQSANGSARVHDCWNSIGVRGDRSCPELATHVHCHNCPAHTAAAAALFSRENAGTADEADWSRDYAAVPVKAGSNTHSALLVRLGQEWFALPVLALDQVIESCRVHTLPHARNPALLGLVNVRGELLVCISLVALLGVEALCSSASCARMVVMRSSGGRIAFPVDEVEHHCRFSDDAIRPLPVTARISARNFATGLIEAEGRLAGVISEERLSQAVESCLS